MAKGRMLLDSLAMRRADRSGCFHGGIGPARRVRGQVVAARHRGGAGDDAGATRAGRSAPLRAAREAVRVSRTLREVTRSTLSFRRVAPWDLAARRTLPRGGVYVSYLVADDRMTAWTLPATGRCSPTISATRDRARRRRRVADAPHAIAERHAWRLADRSHRFALSQPEPGATRVPTTLRSNARYRHDSCSHWPGRSPRRRMGGEPRRPLTAMPYEALRLGGRRIASDRCAVRANAAIHRVIRSDMQRSPASPAASDALHRRRALCTGRSDVGAAARRLSTAHGTTKADVRSMREASSGRRYRQLARDRCRRCEVSPRGNWKGALASERRLRERDRGGASCVSLPAFRDHGYLSRQRRCSRQSCSTRSTATRRSTATSPRTELVGYTFASSLAVLSACDTAAAPCPGRGHHRLAVSHSSWRAMPTPGEHVAVYDETTARFISRFFERVPAATVTATRSRPSSASLLADPATAAPVHWAGFVLTARAAVR